MTFAGVVGGWAWARRLVPGLLLAALAAGGAIAQTPSTKIGTAPLVDPASLSGYGAALSSVDDDLGTRPREIVLLSQALRNGRPPEAFVLETYNYVRNNIRIAWMFGLQKGGLGAVIDRSGTAFDQAELMVEVLRDGGVSAAYQYGTITLTGEQFAQWSGVTSAKAACQLLSSGGIPASINNTVSAGCAYTGSVSTVTLSHVWVKVSYGGVDHLFDPAFKEYDTKAGDAGLAAKAPAGGALAAATGGAQSGSDGGVAYVKALNAPELDTKLRKYAGDVQCLIEGGVANGEACAAAGAHAADAVEDLVGGREIRRAYATAPTVPRTLPYPSQLVATWAVSNNGIEDDGIPDAFRTKLAVKVARCPTGGCGTGDVNRVTILERQMFVDDIYGRKLMLIARDQPSLGAEAGHDVLRVVDEFGGYITVDEYASTDTPTFNDAKVTLTVDHPYPTAAGASSPTGYMDATTVKRVFMWMPLVIVNGWGDVGKGYADKWGAREDSQAPWWDVSRTGCEDAGQSCNDYAPSAGDGRREQLAAGWLTQSARAAQLHAALAKSQYTHHHSIGVVSAETAVTTLYWDPNNTAQILGYSAGDSFDRIDIETAFSLTSETGDATQRRAAVHAIATTLELLEGTVAGLTADAPDVASVANRFAWGNAPPVTEDNPVNPGQAVGARRFFDFTAPIDVSKRALLRFEGKLPLTYSGNDGVHSQNEPEISWSEAERWVDQLYEAVTDYTAQGFRVVAADEAFLGPGQRGGAYRKNGGNGSIQLWTWTHSPTYQRGGAFVATKYDGSEPVEIAHVVVGDDFRAKGGGVGAQAGHQAQYDPKKAADILKSRFVDRSSAVGVDLLAGNVTYSSPARLEIGQGEFPEKLSAEIFWRGGDYRQDLFAPAGHTEPQTPWSTNWHNQLSVSGSAMEAMGATDIRATAATLAAFMAMQDVYRASPSAEREVTAAMVGAWWARTLVHNVVTVNVGAGTQQFFRRFDKVWFAPGPGRYAVLTQTNEPEIHTKKCGGGPAYVATRGWNYAPATGAVSFTVRGANGDVQTFPYWGKRINVGAFCADVHGFRMTSWAFPRGVNVNLTYTNDAGAYDYLKTVSNNLGRTLTFNYNGGWVSSITDGQRTVTLGVDPNDTRISHTDPEQHVTKFATTIAGNRYQLTAVYAADAPDGLPALKYEYDAMGRVSEARDRLGLAPSNPRPSHKFLLAHGLHGERVAPDGGRYAVDYDDDKRPVRFVDEIGRIVTAAYDGRGRPIAYTYPEGDQEKTGYDDHNNPTIMVKVAKPGSPQFGAPLVVQAEWDPYWNKPLRILDARQHETTFEYAPLATPGAGELSKVTRPPVEGGTPVYTFTYNAYGQPLTTTDPTALVTQNAYDGQNYLASTTVSAGQLNLTTSFTNNAFGDPTDINGPRQDVSDVSHVTYDDMRRKELEIAPDPGTGKPTAKRTSYDAVGRPWKTEQGYMSGGVFQPVIATTLTLDAVGNKVRETTPAGVTEFSYDPMNRLECTAKRMSGTTGVHACTRTTQGDFGPDQISFNDYDLSGQLEQVRIGIAGPDNNFGTGFRFARYLYSPNGQNTAVIDGNNNLTLLVYDGYDRLVAQYFPSPSPGAGAHNPDDYESYAYDPNGNRVGLRKRDGQSFTFDFDANDRMVRKIVHSEKPQPNVAYSYDLAGRIASFVFEGGTGGITYGYDAAKRLTSETSFGRTVGFDLDAAGNRVRMSWPGGVLAAEYAYDAANRLTRVREPDATSGVGVLALFHYDDLGRRLDIVRGNGATTEFGYDAAGRLQTLEQAGDPAATAPQPNVQVIAYTPASQIRSLTQTNLNYVWTGRPPYANETHNGLNQISRFAAIRGYDRNGNLTKAEQRIYEYDAENRLTKATLAGVTLDLAYDPAGRLYSASSGSATTYFLYSGDKLVAEYGAPSGETALRRYVHGDGVDEPLVWYEGSGYFGRSWLHADRQGSIVGWSDSGGGISTRTYGPWGEVQDWSGPRFRYTGQVALPEVQLYHYKARAYDPVLGRFLQIDPIGQEADPNLYAYVRGDPLNRADPEGTIDIPVRHVDATATGNLKVDAYAGPKVITDPKAVKEHGPGHIHIKDGNKEARIDTQSWRPLKGDESEVTQNMKRFLKNISPATKDYIKSAQSDIFERGHVSAASNIKAMRAIQAGNARAREGNLPLEQRSGARQFFDRLPPEMRAAIRSMMNSAAKGNVD